MTTASSKPKRVYWHADLPPLEAQLMAVHWLEADSSRVEGVLGHRDELWNRCYDDLMTETNRRLPQEIERLGGRYAHVHDEAISPRHDHSTGEAWLHGSFTYALYTQRQKP